MIIITIKSTSIHEKNKLNKINKDIKSKKMIINQIV